MSTVEFSFGQVEAVCADLCRIAPEKRVAFVGRLKQLQKQGLTEGRRPGRGKAGAYSFGDLMRFVVAVEFIRSGIMPQTAARLVNGSWELLRTNIYLCSFAAEDTVGFTRGPKEYLWMLDVDALRPMTRRGEHEADTWDRIHAVPIDEAAALLAKGISSDPEVFGESWRTLVLNGYSLTQRVMKNIAFHFGWASRQELRDDIRAEILEWNDDVRKFAEEFDNLPPMSPEKRAEFERRMREMMDTDYSTSPPTPRHVYVERAKDVIKFLPDDLRTLLAGPVPTAFTITEETRALLRQLIELEVIEIAMGEGPEGYNIQSIYTTPFGAVLIEELGGEWGKSLTKSRIERPVDPLAEDADAAIALLSDEERAAILSRDGDWCKEPMCSRFQKLGLVNVEEGPLDSLQVGFTDVGRAVLFALRKSRHQSAFERKLNGDDQEA